MRPQNPNEEESKWIVDTIRGNNPAEVSRAFTRVAAVMEGHIAWHFRFLRTSKDLDDARQFTHLRLLEANALSRVRRKVGW